MLTYRLLKNHAGVLLCGDYLTLRGLHEIVHEVSQNSLLVRTRKECSLGWHTTSAKPMKPRARS
jgi:hypothetical protein